tara:strand:+ start:42 stop:206 length:165 start_codon:yes stop_codon:yes gene_type:complete
MREVEGGRTVNAVCRQYWIAEGTYYTWKSKYGGREVADLSLDHKVLTDIVDKKL